MGMFSEIATEGTIRDLVQQLKRELDADFPNASGDADRQEARAAIKRMGRYALTQFEWERPDWAREYETLFADAPRPESKW